jgi:hypothetical protein
MQEPASTIRLAGDERLCLELWRSINNKWFSVIPVKQNWWRKSLYGFFVLLEDTFWKMLLKEESCVSICILLLKKEMANKKGRKALPATTN